WFPEAQFGCAKGVIRTRVGYTGGTKKSPTYHSLGDHTETIQIEFDPKQTSYETLLTIFWNSHNSTACTSRQYMSAIFYHGDDQKRLAEKTKEEHQKKVTRQIQTRIKFAETFYDAEDYHQKYMLRHHQGLLKSLNLSSKEMITSHAAARLNGYLGGFGMLKNLELEIEELGLNEEQKEYVRKKVRMGGHN
ncbi:peptide methionine sulfoxide reductase-like, partial [Acanthaster planci]|uniref:peptide-methionine (S)-S-oxide reductase n=1 Tax=Acanthaster planci TaxID=133434 RepID=A0A8B7YMM3_ACAPL